MKEITGLATGVGSLPHRNAEEALDLVFKYTPEIPFWPQLPKRDKREGMAIQFMQHIAPIPQSANGDFFGAIAYPSQVEKRLEEFYKRIISQDIDYFQIREDYAKGLYAFKKKLEDKPNLLKDIKFIKCQISGPFTAAASIKNEEGIAYLHDSIAMQAFIEGLAMKALWQIKFFEKFGKKIIMFVDEPYLGCFGSAYTPINREEVVKGLTELTRKIKSEDVLVGVHCCGNTDWSIFTDIKTIDIISFDAFSFLDKLLLYTDNLKSFFKRNGVLCWGVVPTSEFTGKETSDLLISKLNIGIETLVKKGIDRSTVLNNLLISPSCGMGSLDSKSAENILAVLSEVSKNLRK